MRLNVLPSNVRAKALISILFTVKNQTDFMLINLRAKPFCAKKEAKLKWHVKARKSTFIAEFGTRDVVNAESTISDYLYNLINSYFAGVFRLQRRSCYITAIMNSKYQRLDQRKIAFIKWAVDEDIKIVVSRSHTVIQIGGATGATFGLL